MRKIVKMASAGFLILLCLTLNSYIQADSSGFLLVFDRLEEEYGITMEQMDYCELYDIDNDLAEELVIEYRLCGQEVFEVYDLVDELPVLIFSIIKEEANKGGEKNTAQNFLTNKEISIAVEGKTLSFTHPPIILNDHAMIALREFTEQLGGRISYEDRTITISTGRTNAVMQLGSKTLIKNGQTYDYEVAPVLAMGRYTYVPAQMLANVFGMDAAWDSESRMVRLVSNIDNLAGLKAQVEQSLAGQSGEWSVYVKNLSTDAYFEINNKALKPASVIKLFNMVGAYGAINKGFMTLDSKTQDHLENMITVSSNESSNTIVKMIGNNNFDAGAARVTALAAELGCWYTVEEHGLYDYAVSGDKGTNKTSVSDCGLILEKIYDKKCIAPRYDEQMLSLLLAQTRRNKIPALLPAGIKTANKTGETSTIEADVGIVYSPSCDFIVCVISNNFNSAYSAQTSIAKISKLVYNYFNP